MADGGLVAGPVGDVRVVIATHRSAADVARAIASALAQGLHPSQVTVVDNASPDGTVAAVRAAAPGVRLLAAPTNLGFARACNRGAAAAGGGALLLLNPDAVLQPGSLAAMLAALDADPRRGAISPRIDRPDGRLDAACRRTFPSPVIAFYRLSGLSRLFPHSPRLAAYNRTHLPVDAPGPIDSGSGACLLLRRSAWDAVGGFDERYFMYGEDLDLCWRLAAAGWTTWYEPGARVVHRKGASSEQAAVPMLVAFHQSMWRFYRTHYARGGAALLAPLVGAAILARAAALVALNLVRRHPRVSP